MGIILAAVEPTVMRRLVGEARVARLATLDPDGRANQVPFTFVLAGDTVYSGVDRKPKTSSRLRRLANVERDPRVTVLVDHYEDDWSRIWWVRLRGRGRVLEEGPDRERAIRLLAEKYQQYRAAPPPGPVLAVDVEEWRGWAASPLE
jgi:PPOX class probable F420-dependent enzyme